VSIELSVAARKVDFWKCYFADQWITIDAQAPPQLVLNSAAGTYIVVGLDIDAPFPSFTALSPLLHWLPSGLKPHRAINGSDRLESSGTLSIANYLGPFPPPGSSPHRYLLLYEQPANFDIGKFVINGGTNVGVWPRTRYDLGAFENEAQLGPVLAANYFKSN
jgi:phosphatidylethanolamine-binding protein